MRRNQIIFGVVLMLVLASFGGVYQFYFKEKLAQYNKDREFRKSLEKQAQDLEMAFSRTNPETVIAKWKNEIQPWTETLEQRAAYFSDGQWRKHETWPENRMLKVWYGEEINRMRDDLYQKLSEKAPYISPFPDDILKKLEVQTEEELSGNANNRQELTPAAVYQQLSKLAFAVKMIDKLLDEKVVGIEDISIWPRRKDKNQKDLLELQTVGLDMYMYMRNLVHFLESMRRERRYFNVDAMHLSNTNIADTQEPLMRVKLILTQAEFGGVIQAQQGGDKGSVVSLYNMTTPRTFTPPPPPPPDTFGTKMWKWFNNKILRGGLFNF